MPNKFLKSIGKALSKPKRKPAKKTAKKKTTTKKKAKKVAKKKSTKKKVKKAVRKRPKKIVKKAKKKVTKKKSKKVVKKRAKKVAKKKSKKTTKKKAKKKVVKKKAKKKVAKKKAKKKAVKKKAKKKVVKKKVVKKVEKKPRKSRKKLQKRYSTKIIERKLESVSVPDHKKHPWDANRSKIKAAIDKGLMPSYFSVRRVLYVGAAHGYTISHLIDFPLEVYAVEKSPEMMRHFMPIAENLASVLPIYGDATKPESYAHLIPEKVDLLFQDIAQSEQVKIFLNNCERFLSRQGIGMLALKAKSVSSTAEPATIFAEARKQIEASGGTIIQEIKLDPYQRDHRMYVIHMNPYAEWDY